jgi:hypothetical protein
VTVGKAVIVFDQAERGEAFKRAFVVEVTGMYFRALG